MATLPTTTLTISIDAPPAAVAADLADPRRHPEWATEFFSGPADPTDSMTECTAMAPMMGGRVRFRIDADIERGILDLYLAPDGQPFGPPLPVRLIPNGDGVDVLWTLTRFPETPHDAWENGVRSMTRELERLQARHGAPIRHDTW